MLVSCKSKYRIIPLRIRERDRKTECIYKTALQIKSIVLVCTVMRVLNVLKCVKNSVTSNLCLKVTPLFSFPCCVTYNNFYPDHLSSEVHRQGYIHICKNEQMCLRLQLLIYFRFLPYAEYRVVYL